MPLPGQCQKKFQLIDQCGSLGDEQPPVSIY
jgi:hypothetical protein